MAGTPTSMSGSHSAANQEGSTEEKSSTMWPFAVHNGGTLFVFCAANKDTHDKWVTAFTSLEDAKLNGQREMWVDNVRQKMKSIEMLREISQKKPQATDARQAPNELSGYLSRTDQTSSSMTNDRFFETYFYDVDFFASKLIMRKKKGSKILFKANL